MRSSFEKVVGVLDVCSLLPTGSLTNLEPLEKFVMSLLTSLSDLCWKRVWLNHYSTGCPRRARGSGWDGNGLIPEFSVGQT